MREDKKQKMKKKGDQEFELSRRKSADHSPCERAQLEQVQVLLNECFGDFVRNGRRKPQSSGKQQRLFNGRRVHMNIVLLNVTRDTTERKRQKQTASEREQTKKEEVQNLNTEGLGTLPFSKISPLISPTVFR
jgi:hypothetical protein